MTHPVRTDIDSQIARIAAVARTAACVRLEAVALLACGS
jgi:hypothetical protein